ncbi:MAG TPA: SRPBCC family protein [Ktedonobacteraceae bacterium]|nr:SRPBCC family protein [Ktedonobacteraceae bacterium]
MDITVSIITTCPAPQLFDFVSNYENDPQWRSGVLKMTQYPQGCSQIGTKTDEVAIFFGRKTRTPADVTAYEPGRMIAFAGKTDGGVQVTGSRRVDQLVELARFTYQAHIEVTGVLWLVEPLLASILRRRFRKDLQRLKALLETV